MGIEPTNLTSTTGKWQLATLEQHPDHIREAGFDSWCIWQIWKDGAKTERHWSPVYNEDGEVRDDIAGRFGPDVLADYVIEQMTEAKQAEKPFLIVHNELLPHWPIVESPDDRELKRKPSLANTIAYMDKLVGRLLDCGDESLFDGEFRLFRKSGKLIDARKLPAEPAATKGDPAAERARQRLRPIFEKLTRTGSRPPEPFTTSSPLSP